MALIAVGCGGGTGGGESSSSDRTTASSACESSGFVIEAHGIDCESARAMIVLLNGRARHQSLTFSDDRGHHAVWTCTSQSIVGPLSCRDGKQNFTLMRAPR
jgi:hypothetical protein